MAETHDLVVLRALRYYADTGDHPVARLNEHIDQARALLAALSAPSSVATPETDYWAKIGALLKTGGMNDPAFLYGQVQAMVDAVAPPVTQAEIDDIVDRNFADPAVAPPCPSCADLRVELRKAQDEVAFWKNCNEVEEKARAEAEAERDRLRAALKQWQHDETCERHPSAYHSPACQEREAALAASPTAPEGTKE